MKKVWIAIGVILGTIGALLGVVMLRSRETAPMKFSLPLPEDPPIREPSPPPPMRHPEDERLRKYRWWISIPLGGFLCFMATWMAFEMSRMAADPWKNPERVGTAVATVGEVVQERRNTGDGGVSYAYYVNYSFSIPDLPEVYQGIGKVEGDEYQELIRGRETVQVLYQKDDPKESILVSHRPQEPQNAEFLLMAVFFWPFAAYGVNKMIIAIT